MCWGKMTLAILVMIHINSRLSSKKGDQAVHRLHVKKSTVVILVDTKYPSFFMKGCAIFGRDHGAAELHDIMHCSVVAATLQPVHPKERRIDPTLSGRRTWKCVKRTHPSHISCHDIRSRKRSYGVTIAYLVHCVQYYTPNTSMSASMLGENDLRGLARRVTFARVMVQLSSAHLDFHTRSHGVCWSLCMAHKASELLSHASN